MKLIKKITGLWSKARLYVVLAAILIILLSIIHYQRGQIQSWKGRHSDVLEIAKRDSASATFYKNKYGIEVATNKQLTLTARDAIKLAETQNLKFLKQIEDLRRNYSNLERTIQIQGKLMFETTLPIVTEPNTLILPGTLVDYDTSIFLKTKPYTPTHRFSYADKFNTLEGVIKNDSVSIKGSSLVPMYGAIYWNRKKFLGIGIGKKVYQNAFFTTNPWAKITGTEVIKIQRKK